jgi:5-methylcytosine-specific restriction endonuclease McrA
MLLKSRPPLRPKKKTNQHHGFVESDECWRHIQAPISGKHILEITPLANKKSKYNSEIYTDTCTICNKPAHEVHHIKYQSDGIDNNLYNLVPLCKKCHNEEHNGYLIIKGYIMTSEGRKLDYVYNRIKETTAQTSAQICEEPYKLTQEDINTIKTCVKYSVAGWFLKKTPKGKWQLSSADNIIAFINHKFYKIASNLSVTTQTIDHLKTHLLVV